MPEMTLAPTTPPADQATQHESALEDGSSRDRVRRSGQVLILFALMLPALLGMAALGTDVAYLYAQKRDLQSAADLAAVAGAADLPFEPAAGTAAAAAFATKNGWTDGVAGASVTIVTPYGGEKTKIEVTITYPAPTFFASILGITTVDITARAVAYHIEGHGYAIFANQSGCSKSSPVPAGEVLDWPGSLGNVLGKVHTNSGIKQGGSGNEVEGSASYVCNKDISGSDNTYSSGLSKTGTKDLPGQWSAADFPCTFNIPSGDINASGSWWADGAAKTKLKPGVYCATGLLKLSTSGVSGTVTFVAKGSSGLVEISGSNYNLKPYANGVLIFSEGAGKDKGAKLAGSGGSWTGEIWAPAGMVEMSGSNNFTLKGGLIGNTVKVNGSGWGITYDDSGEVRSRLVE